MPFKVGKDTKYYKCVHNNQTKVCSGCLSPEHIHKECPYPTAAGHTSTFLTYTFTRIFRHSLNKDRHTVRSVNEKSGNSESKSKSEEEAERKENVNIEAVINTDNVQNETRKRKISENICFITNTLQRLD
jgi:hypothetical protein